MTAGVCKSQGLRAAGAARKGGTPGEGSPFNPLLRFFSTRRVPRAAARGQGSAPGPRPLFCKKAGQKTFTGRDFCQPKPLAPGASDSIRPRSGHLSGRVAPPTRVGEAGGPRSLTGAPPPQKRFSLGLHPVSLGKTKEMGWNRQRKRKANRQQNGEFLQRQIPPGGDGIPPLQMRDGKNKKRPLSGAFWLLSSTLCLQNTPQARTCRSYSSHTSQLSQTAHAWKARVRPRRW